MLKVDVKDKEWRIANCDNYKIIFLVNRFIIFARKKSMEVKPLQSQTPAHVVGTSVQGKTPTSFRNHKLYGCAFLMFIGGVIMTPGIIFLALDVDDTQTICFLLGFGISAFLVGLFFAILVCAKKEGIFPCCRNELGIDMLAMPVEAPSTLAYNFDANAATIQLPNTHNNTNNNNNVPSSYNYDVAAGDTTEARFYPTVPGGQYGQPATQESHGGPITHTS